VQQISTNHRDENDYNMNEETNHNQAWGDKSFVVELMHIAKLVQQITNENYIQMSQKTTIVTMYICFEALW
jgi:hypothetical protein